MQSEIIEEMDSVEVAKKTMIGDLVQATIDELKAAPDVWQKLSENKQAEVIERLTHRVVHNVTQAVHIIASDDRPTLRANLEQVTVKAGVKAVLTLSKKDPAALDLIEATGEDVLIVLPHLEQYADQEPGVYPDPDQPGLDGLDGETGAGGYGSVSNGGHVPADAAKIRELPDSEKAKAAIFSDKELAKRDALLPEAIELVVSSQRATISSVQRKFKIGYNRAASLIDHMEKLGVISEADSNGRRTVMQQPGNAEGVHGEVSGKLPEGFSEIVERVTTVGAYGITMLKDYDGPQSRAIEKALIEEGIVAEDHYNGARMVLVDPPEEIHETQLQRAERLVVQTQDASDANVGNVGTYGPGEIPVILAALEAKGIVSKPDAAGNRTVIVGGDS